MNQQLLHDEWEENILARAEGELNDEERARFNEHLASCSSCVQEVRDYEFLARRLRSVEQDVVVPALSPALIALQQEIVQHHIQEEAHQIAEQSFAPESKMHAKERLPDDELVARVQSGDHAASVALYDRYAGGMYRYLLQFTHEREDADDLMETIFTKCFQYLERERKPLHFKPWIYTIARHVSLDYARQKSKERGSIALVDEELQADSEAEEVYETFAPRVIPKEPYLPGLGTDEQAIVREMLCDKNSEHWKACSIFVRHYVHARVYAKAKDVPIDVYDDIAQEVMYKITRHLPYFRFQCSLRTWVNQIIEHQIIDERRKLRNEGSNVPTPSHETDSESQKLNTSEVVSVEDTFEMYEQIRTGLEGCLKYVRTHAKPVRNQLIIWKVIFEGETYAEAARSVGCSEAVVGYVVRKAQGYARKRREYYMRL